MPRTVHRSLLAALLLMGASCGGGGGDDAAPCTVTGTLRALALQGQAAPDTAGLFSPFPIGMLMDVGVGGWSVFVVGTTDAANATCLYVAQPDASLLKVFATGETLPGGGGTISGFLVARVNAAGQILAEVTVAGGVGGRTFGLLTAQVVGAAVTAKTALVYHLQDMGVSGISGALNDLDETRVFFLDDGRTVFGGVTSDAEGAWIVNLDGSGLRGLIATGDPLPDLPGPSVTCLDIRALGVAASGDGFAFVADVGGTFEDRLYEGSTAATNIAEVASDGNALPGGGQVLEIYGGGPLLVYNNSTVLWKALGNGIVPDEVILAGNSVQPYIELARSGDQAPSASGGVFGGLDLLTHRGQATYPEIKAELIGVPGGADFATYVVGGGAPLLSVFEGRPAPPDFGESAMFSDQLPGLSAPGTFDIATDGSFAFAGRMQSGSSGMFWILPNCGTFTLAKAGANVPGGGDTFGAFTPQATHTCHTGVVLFRAPLTTAGSGLFRQGP